MSPGHLSKASFIRVIRSVIAYAVFLVIWGVQIESAFAQAYPTQTVKIIVPAAAGGPLDIVARAIADKLSARLGQPFVIDNRTGAAGNVGTGFVARSKPDGHTLLLALGSTLTINPSLYPDLSFDPQRDLVPITIVCWASQMLVVNAALPVHTLAEFVDWAKKQPKVIYGHTGYGTPSHLVMEYFALRAGFNTESVPYRGTPPLVIDLLSGQIKVAFGATVGLLPQLGTGALRPLAVSSAARSALAPDVPTVAEAGYPNFKLENNFILLAPKATPAPIVAKLQAEVAAAMTDPEIQKSFRIQDLTIVASTSDVANSSIKAETELWAGVVKQAGMKAQ